MYRRAPTASLALLVSLLVPVRVEAEPRWGGEWTVGLAPSYAFVVLEKQSKPRGGGGQLFVRYGLTGTFALGVSALWSAHDTDATSDSAATFQVINVAASVTYSFDWLERFTPAIEGGIGLLYRRSKTAAADLGLQLGVAADYWVLPWLGLGAAFHYHAFITSPTEYPVFFDAGPRLTARWR